MSAPPNILYIFTDQQRHNAMSCAGNPHVHTPAADRLAAEEVRFSRAYCAQPVAHGDAYRALAPCQWRHHQPQSA